MPQSAKAEAMGDTPPCRQPSSTGTPAHPLPASSATAIAAARGKHSGSPRATDPQELEFLAPGYQSPHYPVEERRGRHDSLVLATSLLPPLTDEVDEPSS
jgi:hypothetical protein